MKRTRWLLICLCLLSILAGCRTAPAPAGTTARPPAEPAQATESPTQIPPTTEPSVTANPASTATTATTATTTTACFDAQAAPLPVPARSQPLEVRFIGDGNIWIWEEEPGSAAPAPSRQITDTGDALRFSFSPDGEVIAYERAVDDDASGKVTLWAVNRDGSSPRQLVSAEQFDALLAERHPAWAANRPRDYAWLPGTHNLTFGVYPLVNALGGSEAAQGYWQVNTDTLALQPWQDPIFVDPYGPRRLPSPDGATLALIDRESTSLYTADGTPLLLDAVRYPANNNAEGFGWLAPTAGWTPDSRFLRILPPQPAAYGETETFTAWQIPADGSPAQKMAIFEGSTYGLALSPDRQVIAYLRRLTPTSNDHELHLARFDGSRDMVYDTGRQLQIQGWLPDSYHFVYSQWQVEQPMLGSLCGPPLPLLDPADTPATQLTWVDNTRFLYVFGQHELRLGQRNGPSLRIGEFRREGVFYTVE